MPEILQRDSPILRKTAKEVHVKDIGSEKIRKALKDMKDAMASQKDGVAIAAPQIGVSLRIFMVSGDLLAKADKTYKGDGSDLVFINPVIVRLSREKKEVEEGCLSVRWLYGMIRRSTKATLKALNEEGEPIERGASGLLAQIFQHEVDHLNGILFTDKADNVWEMSEEEIAELKKKINIIPFAFFGSSRFSVIVLDELEKLGFIPAFVVTTPDKPKGRKLELTLNEVKTWALQRDIKAYDPAKLDADLIERLKIEDCGLFIVASFGKIIPEAIVNLPKYGTLNIHPSLLPRYRGPSPLPTAMLEDAKHTGVTIMRMDKEMDHGPIVAQKEIAVNEWPAYEEFEEMMAREGARLLSEIIPDWVAGKIIERAQDHPSATYTKKTLKEDGLLELSDDPYLNFRKIQAYHGWPQAYFFMEHLGKKMRVKVARASFGDGLLIIEKVVPEGGKEMAYEDFKRGYGRNP